MRSFRILSFERADLNQNQKPTSRRLRRATTASQLRLALSLLFPFFLLHPPVSRLPRIVFQTHSLVRLLLQELGGYGLPELRLSIPRSSKSSSLKRRNGLRRVSKLTSPITARKKQWTLDYQDPVVSNPPTHFPQNIKGDILWIRKRIRILHARNLIKIIFSLNRKREALVRPSGMIKIVV